MSNLWSAFTAVAHAESDAASLIFPGSQISFGQLKTFAERCSARLSSLGVAKGDVVALQLPKRVEAYALLLACLRLGAPYVFIDPKAPAKRTTRILDRIRPKILFTSDETQNAHGDRVRLPSAESGTRWIQELPPIGENDSVATLMTGTDPAYIMFTSGSTGEPKGAIISHQGILNLMDWARTRVCTPRSERFTNINPLHFDNSVFDIYCGLLNGAALIPIETAELTSPVAWVKAIRNAEATIVFAVPTLFLILDRLGLLTPASLPKVKTLLFGGEGYPIARLRDLHARFRDQARLINVYGPTETSCICTSIEIDEDALQALDSEFPSLGRMHENFFHAILDEELNPVAAGGVGELWIGGPCVGLGYYASPVETSARFRQDPRQDRDRSIFYRSGDLVREDDRGRLWFHGRVDNQVKVRGHRIELEEIDLAVQSIPGVRRAIAVVLSTLEGEELNVAFVADHAIDAGEIHALCKAKLPAYMRPARVFQLDDLPRNANGKVDRLATKALLARLE